MNAKIRAVLFTTAVVTLALSVFPAAAQVKPILNLECGLLGLKCDINNQAADLRLYIFRLINISLILASVIALAVLILGGLRYILAQGDESKLESAKKTILYAIIGLIVIGLAAVIVNFVFVAIRFAE